MSDVKASNRDDNFPLILQIIKDNLGDVIAEKDLIKYSLSAPGPLTQVVTEYKVNMQRFLRAIPLGKNEGVKFYSFHAPANQMQRIANGFELKIFNNNDDKKTYTIIHYEPIENPSQNVSDMFDANLEMGFNIQYERKELSYKDVDNAIIDYLVNNAFTSYTQDKTVVAEYFRKGADSKIEDSERDTTDLANTFKTYFKQLSLAKVSNKVNQAIANDAALLQGGSEKSKYIMLKNKKTPLKVKIDKQHSKYVLLNRKKVLLSTLKGKYRYLR